MVSYLTLPIRLLGIVLMASVCLQVVAPLRSIETTFSNLGGDPGSQAIVATSPQTEDASSLISMGLGLVAIVSIWLIYQTWQQQTQLANGELRRRRDANKE
ncbi:hypothetical protein [Mariniblastus fucicola]|uniref:Uncharacterized protein n=1 Tax=Mariniblastus fucicola TaxID=980251 RepID=A0A5B9PDW6_9BACT|nr:hypothetical protein [Mariniblastus fucicola]QEG23132.1 hypothetical protein MFFC18_30270 [Mariniblastus fucicola]